MIKLIVLVIGLSQIICLDAIALTGGTTTTCDVGEQEKVVGLCPDGKSSAKCSEYCQRKFGGELIASQCTHERPNGKRECICRLKCCNQGCWGDPHCWTCDGSKFGYQGLKKYYVLKSLENFPTFPEFEIRQINRPWQKGPMAILDISEFFIKDWGITAVFRTPRTPRAKYHLTINDRNESIPYRYSKINDNREQFLNIAWGDAKQTQVVVKTSFGLKIVYTTKTSGAHVYSDISIDTPRHPEIKGKLGGILGGWDGNRKTDGTGPDGKKHPLDIKFSWKFGDSWIVPGGRTPTAECVINEDKKKVEEFQNNIDKTIKAQAEKLCEEVLNRPQLQKCADDINRALPSLENCVLDQLFLESAKERKAYIADLIRSFEKTCKRRGRKKGHRDSSSSESVSSSSSSSSSSESRGSGSNENDHNDNDSAPKKQKVTKPKKEHNKEKPKKEHKKDKPKKDKPKKTKTAQPAPAPHPQPQPHPAPHPHPHPAPAPAPAPKPAPPPECPHFNLVPLYRLFHPGLDDHFYTTNHAEAVNANKNLGYNMEGSPGFVATAGHAKLQPVYRMFRPGGKCDHFYTQNKGEADNAAAKLGYHHEGIAFYCPPNNACGASAPFYRYWRNAEHFYTTNHAEGQKNVVALGGRAEGVLCSIWPNAAHG